MPALAQTFSREELISEIEKVRTKMHHLSEQMQRTSEEVVSTSTYLDELLNQFQQLNAEENK